VLSEFQVMDIKLLAWAACLLSAQVQYSEQGGWAGIERVLLEVVSEVREIDAAGQETIGIVTHRRIGFSRNGEVYYFSGHDEKAKGEDWLREPYNLEQVVKNGWLTTHRHFLRAYEKEKFPQNARLPASISNDAIMFVLPYWLPDKLLAPGDYHRKIYFVVDKARKSEFYEPLKELKTIGDLDCIGFANRERTDIFWIASQKWNLVLEREWYSNDKKTEGYRLHSQHYREFYDGVWLPSEYDVLFSDDNWKTTKTIRKTRILNVLVNDQFQPFDERLRDGAIRLTDSNHGKGKDFIQTHPGGTDLLEEVSSLIRGRTKRSELNFRERAIQKLASSAESVGSFWLWKIPKLVI